VEQIRLALEIALHGGDCLDYLWRRRAAFRAGQPAQQSSFGRFRAFCRQLKARDTHVVPGDAAKAAGSFEDEIMMRCLAHHIALAFRSTIELVRASGEFNRILAFSVAAESMSAQ
jgi:hypothetical protein